MLKIFQYFHQSLNNRELALTIWIIIALIFCIAHSKIRKSLVQVIKALFAWKLTASYLLMFIYISFIVIILKHFGLWDTSNIPLTIIWILSIAFVSLFRFQEANSEDFFKRNLKDSIGVLVVIEYIANFYVFPFWIEFILIPIFTLIGGLLAIAETDNKYHSIKRVLQFILTSLGLFILILAMYSVLTDFNHFVSIETFKNFYLPIILSIAFLPFIYLTALFVKYEDLFTRFRIFISDANVLKYAKLKSLSVSNINLWKLNKWSNYVHTSWRFKSRNEVDTAISEFRKKQCLKITKV